ncbi:MAG: hypothetical protein WBO10_11095 [Pyrinomonadaceae bacterium]
MKKLVVVACLAVVFVLTMSARAADLSAQEVVAKHLDAVGSKEKRDSITTIMAIGASEFESKTPVVKGGGRAIVVSDPDNLFWVISLNSREYPFEKIGYFRDKVSLPFISAGTRSLLGSYLADHSQILGDGLFGGVMSLRWTLLNLDKMKARLSGGGIKKIDGRKLHAVEYNSQSGGGGSANFAIKLYFDPETFYHVRTEYRFEVTSREATFGQQNQRSSAVVNLTEQFSDFKSIDGLTLPHKYNVTYATNSNTGMYENTWGIRVAEYRINQKLQPDFFTFDVK